MDSVAESVGCVGCSTKRFLWHWLTGRRCDGGGWVNLRGEDFVNANSDLDKGVRVWKYWMDLKMMKAILLFLFALSAVGQTTFNNLAVKTNLTLSSVSTSRGLVIDGNSNVVASTATKQQVDKGQMQVPTAADLVALTTNLVDSVVVQTAGRLTAGDGGAAKFYWSASSTASTNRGTVLKLRDSSVGRWIWLGGAPIDVRMFGAIPNDATIDSDALDEAIAVGVATKTPTFIPPGGYFVSRPLVITNGEVFGIRTEQSRVDTGVNTVLIATNWDASTYKSILKIVAAGPGVGAPSVHGIEVIGSRTNTPTKRRITSVTDRYTFEVSNAYTPSFQSGSRTNWWPFFGWAFVFSPSGNYMGAAVITGTTNTGTAWRLTTRHGLDLFATPAGTGGLLTTNCYLVFSELTTISTGAQLTDATKVGVSGIEITGGIGARVSDCATYDTWVGVNFGVSSSTSFPFIQNITTWRTAFAGYAYGVRSFEGAADVMHNGYLFANGYGAAKIEVSTDGTELGNGTFGFYNLPTTSSYSKLWVDGFVFGGALDVNGGISVDDMLLDNCMYGGLLVIDGQYNNGASVLSSIGKLRIRGSLQSAYPIQRADSFGIRAVGTLYPANIHLGTLDIPSTFQSNLGNAFDITNAVAHQISIGRMPISSGYTNWLAASSLLPIIENSEVGQTNRFLGISYSQSTNYLNGASWIVGASGTNRIVAGPGGVYGYAGNTPTLGFSLTSSAFTAIGAGAVYNKVDSSGVYVGNRSSGSSSDASSTVLVDPGSGNAGIYGLSHNGTVNFYGRASAGTQASPTAPPPNQTIVGFGGQTYDGSSYNTTARIAIAAAGTTSQSSTNRASRIDLEVTPDGSTTRSASVRIGGGGTRNIRVEPDGVSANADSTAAIDVVSTTQGILFPRMTTTQRDAIASAPSGLVIYNTSTSKLQVRAAGSWADLH